MLHCCWFIYLSRSASPVQTSIPPSSRALDCIRVQTAESHQHLEDALDLLRESFGRADYVALIGRFLGFYEPLEALLRDARDWSAIGIDAMAREKAHSLTVDLRALGQDNPAALPRCAALPDVSTPARALGAMYVLEGSTLGGQMITRHFQARWGLAPETGGAFFSSYGAEVGLRWREFRAALEAGLQSDHDQAQAAEAAAETFECLEVWMTGR